MSAPLWCDHHGDRRRCYDCLRSEFDSLHAAATRLLEVHEQVEMDAPEDKALHARVCKTFRDVLDAHSDWNEAPRTAAK